MTQLNPTTSHYMQAIALLRDLSERIRKGTLSNPQEIDEEIKGVLTEFSAKVGQPLSTLEKFVKGEPLLSMKMNRILMRLQDDVNILQEQASLLQASSLSIHNWATTEMLRAQNQNAQALNKLKTLQLYSTAKDSNMIVVGDFFKNKDMMDDAVVPIASRVDLTYSGNVTLGRAAQSSGPSILNSAKIKILPTSNGFAGNNQEIDPTSITGANLWEDNEDFQPDYRFVSETARNADIREILDGEPNTWFEYEYCQVSDADREKALNLNFVYRTDKASDSTAPKTSDLLDWATGPGVKSTFTSEPDKTRSQTTVKTEDFGKLKLDLEIDLGILKRLNSFSITPYGMRDNSNYPILAHDLETSEDGTVWEIVAPKKVWIANKSNIQSARVAEDSVIGSAVWVFADREVRYLRLRLEQPNAMPCNIGHTYWVTKKQTTREVTDDATPQVIIRETGGDRVEGPIPPVSNPGKYNELTSTIRGDDIRRIEVFNGKRWAIGIRDCFVEQALYNETSYMISKAYRINGTIDRVSLEADLYIPEEFDSDKLWVKFFVSPNNGLNWFPISRIQDDYNGIGEILAFNDPLPEEFQEVNVDYYKVPGTLDTIRLKAELSRPPRSTTNSTLAVASPVLRSYQLKIRKR